ncbi:MAG: heparinase II/III family protein, partial [Spirochaetales bacterium]|nr:heparinase II/III family protein [Spirochaetales bacterium]
MKFFIDDMKRIAEYAAANYPAAAAKVLKTADQVVEQKFIFNLRWDMERTSKVVAFDGEIDWLHQPADDAEWVYAFNRMHFWICLGQAYALTGKEIYAETFASQLQSWVKSVKQNDPASQPAWRSIEVGIRMEYWCKAFDYFKDSPAITDEVCRVFYESVAEHARFIMGVWNTYNLMSNWGVLANHGLYIASIAHPQNEETLKWREESLRRLALEMEMQIYEDGTQWEQSPMYHNEVTHCYLDVLILARRNGIALPEGFEKRIQDMCRVNLWWTKPDGHQIAMGDSDVIDTRDITSKGAYLFQDGVLKSGAY